MPTETLVHDNQLGYYRALQESHNGRIEASPFVSFMLAVIEASLDEYSDLAQAARKSQATVERRLAKLRKAALVRRSGSTKNGVWVVSPDWKESIDGSPD
jgi:DNA-binding transcriptional ArsR family regulator